jgi:2-methylisoborneol synthase
VTGDGAATTLAGSNLPAPGWPGPCNPEAYLPLPYIDREWGDGSHSPLRVPVTVRVDEALGEEVDDRLVEWAAEAGLHAGQLGAFRDTRLGQLAMLTHADTGDPGMLLVAARMNAAWRAARDHYAGGAGPPGQLPPRLALVMSAMDPPPPAGRYTGPLEAAIAADPVLVALRSATGHLARHATPAQVMRACGTTFQMHGSWAACTTWRLAGERPAVWRYLAARQHDSCYTPMTLIDVVGGYELPPSLFGDTTVHRALMQAGTASAIVNDLHAAADGAHENVVALIAAEDGVCLRDATERAVELHNDFVRGFEASRRALSAIPSPPLQRFLRGAQAWMAGALTWHGSVGRYQ